MVFSKGRDHIGDGGVNCVTSKGTQRRPAKAIISNFVRECTDDFALFLWCESGDEGVINAVSFQKVRPSFEVADLFLPGCDCDSVIAVDFCIVDAIHEIVSAPRL